MSKGTSEDPLSTARAIFGWGMLSVVFWSFVIFLLTSCTMFCPKPGEVKPVLKPVIKTVYIAGELNKDALAELEKARRIAEAAEQEVAAGRELAELMKKAGSPFAPNVSTFVSVYGNQILELKSQIATTDLILKEQGIGLAVAAQQLQKAKADIAASELQKANLKAAVVAAEKDAEKYRSKYESLKKYRYIIIGISIWLLLKIIGSLGAWTPQGRIARTLIG